MGKIQSQRKKIICILSRTLAKSSYIEGKLHRDRSSREITYETQKKHYHKFGTYPKDFVLIALGWEWSYRRQRKTLIFLKHWFFLMNCLQQSMKNCLYITCSFFRAFQKYVSLKAINFCEIVVELVLYRCALTNTWIMWHTPWALLILAFPWRK